MKSQPILIKDQQGNLRGAIIYSCEAWRFLRVTRYGADQSASWGGRFPSKGDAIIEVMRRSSLPAYHDPTTRHAVWFDEIRILLTRGLQQVGCSASDDFSVEVFQDGDLPFLVRW